MTTAIDLHFSYRVTDEDKFQRYVDAVLPVTERDEPYVLEYSLARDTDGVVLQHERYENEDAIRKHLEATATGQKLWGESTELIDIRFVGPLSDGFKKEFDSPVASWWTADKSIAR